MMPIDQSYSPDLSTPEVRAYAMNRNAPASWDAPILPRPGYDLSTVALKVVGDLNIGQPIKIPWAVREWYDVYEGDPHGQRVGNFDVIVPHSQELKVTILAYLFIKQSVATPERQIIETTFRAYDPVRDGDMNDYAEAKLGQNPQIKRNDFWISYTFRLSHIGSAIADTSKRDAIIGMYRGSVPGRVHPGPNAPTEDIKGEPGYFQKRQIHVRRTTLEVLDEFPADPRDSVHQRDADNKTPTQVLDEIMGVDQENSRCEGLMKRYGHPVLDLLHYPEFRVKMRDFRMEIGCGVWIVLTLPVLQTKESSITLYMYYVSPENLSKYVEDAILDCAWRAALAGAVVGVALGNLPAGIAAFKAGLEYCLVYKFGRTIECLIPGLALITTTVVDWHDI